jgi:antitoxin (DNA-binding transcriptional repressor) of toxin-antitoxin stability system
MKSFGIRQAKAHLSQLVRAASNGECSLVTDNRKPVAMIGPPPQASIETDGPQQVNEETKPLSDATAFRRALFSAPHPLDLDF